MTFPSVFLEQPKPLSWPAKRYLPSTEGNVLTILLLRKRTPLPMSGTMGNRVSRNRLEFGRTQACTVKDQKRATKCRPPQARAKCLRQQLRRALAAKGFCEALVDLVLSFAYYYLGSDPVCLVRIGWPQEDVSVLRYQNHSVPFAGCALFQSMFCDVPDQAAVLDFELPCRSVRAFCAQVLEPRTSRLQRARIILSLLPFPRHSFNHWFGTWPQFQTWLRMQDGSSARCLGLVGYVRFLLNPYNFEAFDETFREALLQFAHSFVDATSSQFQNLVEICVSNSQSNTNGTQMQCALTPTVQYNLRWNEGDAVTVRVPRFCCTLLSHT